MYPIRVRPGSAKNLRKGGYIPVFSRYIWVRNGTTSGGIELDNNIVICGHFPRPVTIYQSESLYADGILPTINLFRNILSFVR